MNRQRPVGFRAAYVFDISQTDGQELPEIGNVNGDPSGYRARLGNFVTEQGITLEYSQDIAPARGTSAGGKITLLPGQSPAEEFATLVHEVAHEKMHRNEQRSKLRSVAAKPRPRPSRSLFVKPSGSKQARQRKITSNSTRATRNFLQKV